MVRKHQFDQHFLASPRLVAELIGHANIRKNDVVYDLGAGSGVITSVLARRCKRVIAVEVEPGALKTLRQNTSELENVEVVEADLETFRFDEPKYKVFANPPFSMLAAIVRNLLNSQEVPTSVYLITQRQFAYKVVMSDRHFTSALGVSVTPFFACKIRRPLRKTDFTPPPAVDTVLLEMRKREEPMLPFTEFADFASFVDTCFKNQKQYAVLLQKSGIATERRKPSELSIDNWLRLYWQNA